MKIVFTKPEMQEMIIKYLATSMGVDVKDKALNISIHSSNSDYLVVQVQDEIEGKSDEEEKE